jgi:NADH dehydrogenase/NADH:ubiquinone oxidoreductase subunit G
MADEKMITLKIDDQEVSVPAGTTILDAAAGIGIEVPVVCYHAHLTGNGLCRVCSVDTGGRVFAAACITEVSDGMNVQTHSEDVIRARRTILEMLAATVDLSESPDLQKLLAEYNVDLTRFEGGRKREMPIKDDNPMYLRDYSKCVMCWRCVQVCAEDAQYAYAINFSGRGFETQISTFMDRPLPSTTCVFCGQCVGVCPTNALKPKREFLLQEGLKPEEIAIMNSGRKKRKLKVES